MSLKIRLILFAGIFILFSKTISAQEFSINSGLNKDTIIFGEQIELNINAKTLKENKIIFPEFRDTLAKNIEIIANFDVKQKVDSLYNTYEKKLLITSFDTGAHIVPNIHLGLVKGNDTIDIYTDINNIYVKSYILLDTIPVDTIYSTKSGFVIRGRDGFKNEIERYIPDSLKKTLPADSLELARQYIKEFLVQTFTSEVTKKTSLYDQDELLKIAESSKQSLYIADKGGVYEKFIVPGSLDTLFVEEFVQVETGQPLFTVFRIKDIDENLYNTPYNFAEFWYDFKQFFAKYWWIVLISIILIAGILYYILFYKKDKKPVLFKPKPKVPAHIIALGKLSKIKDEKIWQKGFIKEFYVNITDVLREYIENRYGIYAKEMTTSEILSSFNVNNYLNPEDYKKLELILLLADSVKFAKYRPLQNENDLSLNKSFEFVENTKEEIIDDSQIKQTEAESDLSENIIPDFEKKEKENDE